MQGIVVYVIIINKEFEKAMKTERAYQALEDGAKLIAYQAAKIFSDSEKIQKMLNENS